MQKLLPKWRQNCFKNCQFWDPFLNPFFGLLWSSFRASWEPSWAYLGSLGKPLDPKKCGFTIGKLHFLKMQLFGSLRLLMAVLGSSGPLLGPIWFQNGLQNGLQKWAKRHPKSDPKNDRAKLQKKCQFWAQNVLQNHLEEGCRMGPA